MSELSNQECRDMKGSLSDRGCYFDKDGKALEEREEATHFSCHDCGKGYDLEHETLIVDKTESGKKILRPICFCCLIGREESEDA